MTMFIAMNPFWNRVLYAKGFYNEKQGTKDGFEYSKNPSIDKPTFKSEHAAYKEAYLAVFFNTPERAKIDGEKEGREAALDKRFAPGRATFREYKHYKDFNEAARDAFKKEKGRIQQEKEKQAALNEQKNWYRLWPLPMILKHRYNKLYLGILYLFYI